MSSHTFAAARLALIGRRGATKGSAAAGAVDKVPAEATAGTPDGLATRLGIVVGATGPTIGGGMGGSDGGAETGDSVEGWGLADGDVGGETAGSAVGLGAVDGALRPGTVGSAATGCATAPTKVSAHNMELRTARPRMR